MFTLLSWRGQTESLLSVSTRRRNKFCFSLSKTVFTECRWHGDTGREGASPYFLSIHKLSLDVAVHVWAVRASERNWEPGGDDDSGPGWPPWSHTKPGTALCLRGVTESRSSQCFIDPQFYQKWIHWTVFFKIFLELMALSGQHSTVSPTVYQH